MCRHRRCRHTHGFGADVGADVLAVEVDVLCAVLQLDAQLDAGQQRLHRFGVFGVNAAAQRVQTDGAVHRAGIDVDVAQLLCQPLGQRGFARPGRTVNGDGNHSFFSF